jgi:hypothetical protein
MFRASAVALLPRLLGLDNDLVDPLGLVSSRDRFMGWDAASFAFLTASSSEAERKVRRNAEVGEAFTVEIEVGKAFTVEKARTSGWLVGCGGSHTHTIESSVTLLSCSPYFTIAAAPDHYSHAYTIKTA